MAKYSSAEFIQEECVQAPKQSLAETLSSISIYLQQKNSYRAESSALDKASTAVRCDNNETLEAARDALIQTSSQDEASIGREQKLAAIHEKIHLAVKTAAADALLLRSELSTGDEVGYINTSIKIGLLNLTAAKNLIEDTLENDWAALPHLKQLLLQASESLNLENFSEPNRAKQSEQYSLLLNSKYHHDYLQGAAAFKQKNWAIAAYHFRLAWQLAPMFTAEQQSDKKRYLAMTIFCYVLNGEFDIVYRLAADAAAQFSCLKNQLSFSLELSVLSVLIGEMLGYADQDNVENLGAEIYITLAEQNLLTDDERRLQPVIFMQRQNEDVVAKEAEDRLRVRITTQGRDCFFAKNSNQMQPIAAPVHRRMKSV